MKVDMGGAAAVLGAAKALGQIKPSGVEVDIFLPCQILRDYYLHLVSLYMQLSCSVNEDIFLLINKKDGVDKVKVSQPLIILYHSYSSILR